jgi:gamma-butyrobetaine dioxygenase
MADGSVMPKAVVVAVGVALMVRFADGGALPIHPLWLRERCRDAASVDPHTEQRLYNPSDLDPGVGITEIAQTRAGQFDISFSDGRTACFDAADIIAEICGGAGDTLPAALAWNATEAAPRPVDWRGCAEEAGQYAALHDFLVHGYVILNHVPARPGAVLEVARCFGFPRETNFGMLFDVRSVPRANDLAYTSLALDPHTDNPYRAPVPGIQLLHCLTNGTPGGLSTLVDGLAVAEALRAEAPVLFDALAATRVRFRYVDAETELVASVPLIELDSEGRFSAIHYSPRLDFVPLLPPGTLEIFYQARRRLDRMLKSASFERRFRLDDGNLMMFDNRRLLHGRSGFDPSAGLRHLQGCYIDADGPRSRYRLLRRRLA